MPYGPTHKEKYMPYGPTHKEQMYALWAYWQRIKICLMGLLTNNRNICLMGLLTKNKNICLMGLLTKNKNMPYGPTHKE